jgi:hypothetical protein
MFLTLRQLTNFFIVGLKKLNRKAGTKRATYKRYYKIPRLIKSQHSLNYLFRYYFWRITLFSFQNKFMFLLLLSYAFFSLSFYGDYKRKTNKYVGYNRIFRNYYKRRGRRRH